MPVINIVLEDLNRMLKDKLSSTDFANIIPKIGADPDEINDSEAIVEFFQIDLIYFQQRELQEHLDHLLNKV